MGNVFVAAGTSGISSKIADFGSATTATDLDLPGLFTTMWTRAPEVWCSGDPAGKALT